MGRPSKWSSETESVRLPKHAIEQCLKLAQLLDSAQSSGFVQNLEPMLATVGEGQFLIQPEPLSRREIEQVDNLYQEVMAELRAKGLTRHQDLCLVVSKLVEVCGTPLN